MVVLAGVETLFPMSLNHTYTVFWPSAGDRMNGIVAPNLIAGVTSTHPGVPAMGVNGLSEMK